MEGSVTIIICTQNRCDSLKQTLASIAECSIPAGLETEILIVDNCSIDDTRNVAQNSRFAGKQVRYIREERSGLSHARNRGIYESTCNVILFTDDDVRVPKDWVEAMCRPLIERTAHGVAGGVRTASHLQKPWFDLRYQRLTTTTEGMKPGETDSMTGANMGFHRSVLEKVRYFDPELGAGALGSMEESLFAKQMVQAGFRIVTAPDVVVDHWFDESRLKRDFFLKAVARGAQSFAYFLYHWEHVAIDNIRLRLLKAKAKLTLRRLTRRGDLCAQVVPEWEHQAINEYYFYRQFLHESRRPRNYDLRGLVKLSGKLP